MAYTKIRKTRPTKKRVKKKSKSADSGKKSIKEIRKEMLGKNTQLVFSKKKKKAKKLTEEEKIAKLESLQISLMNEDATSDNTLATVLATSFSGDLCLSLKTFNTRPGKMQDECARLVIHRKNKLPETLSLNFFRLKALTNAFRSALRKANKELV